MWCRGENIDMTESDRRADHGLSVRFIICTLQHIYHDGKCEKYRIYEGHQLSVENSCWQTKRKDMGGKIILKCILNNWDGRYGLDSSYSQHGLAITSCGDSNYILTR